jgi:hypothetical protein
MKSPNRKLTLFLVALMLATSACSVGAATMFTAEPTAAPTRETVYSVPAASETFQLDSYRATLTVNFSGKRSGQTANGQIVQTTEIDREDGVARHTQTVTGTLPHRKHDAATIEFFKTANEVFVKQDDEAFWFQPESGQQISADEFGILALDSLLVLPTTVTIAPKFEDVDGAQVQQYRFTAANLPASPLNYLQADGAVWLTAENTIVRYEITGTMQVNASGGSVHLLDEGQLQIGYRLENVNRPDSLPPVNADAAIPAKLAEIPRLPDATVTAAFPALLEYSSATSPISVTTFYRNELPQLGWSIVISNVFNEKARLTFSKDRDTVTVLINPAETLTEANVMITLE